MTRLLAGAVVVGSILEILGMPAGMLLGGIIGAALVNQRWTKRMKPVQMPQPLRISGLITLGTVAGVMLTWESMASTALIAVPVAAAYMVLGVVNLLFAWLLMFRYAVDPATAVLAVTPGGFGEVLSLAMDKGAHIPLVLTVHAVRIIVLVLGVLPILLWIMTA